MVATLLGAAASYAVTPGLVIPVAPLVALFSLTSRRPPRLSVSALLAVSGVSALGYLSAPPPDVRFSLVLGIAIWAAGELVRSRRAAVADGAQRAAVDEQARIARELHDVLAHSVSVIVVQAAAAEEVFERRPDQALAALRPIESSGRAALGELRHLLAEVRLADDPGHAARPPSLYRLEDLADQLRAAGLQVVVRQERPPYPVPVHVDAAAYRIAQEAFTNILRHAGATRVEVAVRCSRQALEIDVRDDGRGGAPTGAGRGLIGMRERVTRLGGSLELRADEGDGFHLHARLPMRGSA
jgi:signal transduction histidine kinase